MGIAIGLAEFKSIAKGMEMTDKMTKKSDIKIVENRIVCIGKFFVIISGYVSDVQSAIDEVVSSSDNGLVAAKVIPSLMDGVAKKVNAKISRDSINALGIVESKDIASGFYCANYIKKFADVELLKISMTFGMGGKALVIFTGDLSSVESGLDVARERIGDPSKLVEAVAIASPSREFMDNFLA